MSQDKNTNIDICENYSDDEIAVTEVKTVPKPKPKAKKTVKTVPKPKPVSSNIVSETESKTEPKPVHVSTDKVLEPKTESTTEQEPEEPTNGPETITKFKSPYSNKELVIYNQSTLAKIIYSELKIIGEKIADLNTKKIDTEEDMTTNYKKNTPKYNELKNKISSIENEIGKLLNGESYELHQESLDYAFKSIKKIKETTIYMIYNGKAWVSYDTYFKMHESVLSSINTISKKWVNMFKKHLHYHEVTTKFEPGNNFINHYENFVNLYVESPYKNMYKDVKPDITFVDVYKEYIYKICARDNKDLGDFLIKWTANCVRGNKNDTFISMVSTQEGIGKSIFGDIITSLLAPSMSYPFKIDELAKWTINFKNKILLVLDETGSAGGAHENIDCSAMLKSYVSSKSFSYQGKGTNLEKDVPTGNIIMSSNFPITFADDDKGRRACNVKLSDKWGANSNDTPQETQEKEKRWEKFDENNISGYKALYDFLMTIDLTGFKSQSALKLVKNNTIIDDVSLPSPYQFIKDEYILKRNDNGEIIKTGMSKVVNTELYEQYNNYCRVYSNKCKAFVKKTFYSSLVDIGIESVVGSGGKSRYTYSHEFLKNLFIGKKYLTHAEQYGENENKNEKINAKSLISGFSDEELQILAEYFKKKEKAAEFIKNRVENEDYGDGNEKEPVVVRKILKKKV